MGVKNGSLGTVESLRGSVLQVRLDGEEGRRIVVDSQHYPYLDHGYAATVYKAQGTTVDRTYVLATSHFDRHSTYVALSRHRQAASLFYGLEDFQPAWKPDVDPQKYFKATLARARPKDLAHDYLERPEREQRAPAEPEPTPVRTHERTTDAKGIRMEVAKGSDRAEAPRDRWDEGPERERARWEEALDRYARAWTDAARMRARDLPILEHQKVAYREAAETLEQLRPGAVRDLRNAIEHDPATQRAMTELRGEARTAALEAGLAQEHAIRQDPQRLTRRMVLRWRQLEEEKAILDRSGDPEQQQRFQSRRAAAIYELKRDPQLESLLRQRQRELGISGDSQLGWVIHARDLGQALSMPARDRGLSR